MLTTLSGVMDIFPCADGDPAGGKLFITTSTLVYGRWYWFVSFAYSGIGDWWLVGIAEGG